MEAGTVNMPLVSVCMPAYNAAHYIEEALASLFRQSYKNIEVIVVNDGSTDGTGEILSNIDHPAVKVFHTANNGQCAAANVAYSHSTGRLIKFMDADDLISDQFIEEQVKRIGGREDVIASAGWGRFYNNDPATFTLYTDSVKGDTKPIDWLVTSLQTNSAMMQCARWLIPRAILERSGVWDERLSLINDLEFFIRVMLHASEIRFTHNAVLYYRSGLPSSLSSLKSRKGAESAFHSIDDGMAYILQHENSARTRLVAANCYQNYIFTFYPYHSDLLATSQQKIKELGGSTLKLHAGGLTLFFQKLIGWKLTKLIKLPFS
ncbi:glycosyltransferase family 2 protein [Mucilaginibacter sp. ZT4R22]|uniref:Glycosyltransferase family 2 protein n=1 Tax=Mucilaginibacter pankratovii TaxID=2772110 RepID=A0ABR7WNS6_9SPHI|nr:glycosyltransferase family A protein [Mucilaginibacter pankratovii]MBD1363968.1 glycosyltransferase family 2 protein [Mucilaginibacter pankratovii]